MLWCFCECNGGEGAGVLYVLCSGQVMGHAVGLRVEKKAG